MDQVVQVQPDTLSIDLLDRLYDRVDGPRRGDILVVEDRDDVRLGIAQLLELHGFQVVDAATGEQAMAYLRSDPCGIALVLLDLLLPGTVSGHDFRHEQLAHVPLAAIPTIVVTSCEADSPGGAELRASAWLEKPFHFEALLALVKRYVSADPAAALVLD
jgi:DNA-binding response OmpR family regulator